MNKKTIALLFILLGGAGIYAFFIYGKGFSSFMGGETDFAVEDTAQITRISLTRVIKGEDKFQINLERKEDNDWILNGSYPAFEPRVEQLLQALHWMRIKESLSESAQRTGIKFIETLHTRLDIYKDKKKVKSILIGTQTKDAKGTVMMMAGGRQPYVLEIPGVPGYLNVYFPMEEEVWRENLLFHADLDKLQSLAIEFDTLPEVNNLKWINLEDSPRLASEEKTDPLRAKRYFDNFKGKVYAESFATNDYPAMLKYLRKQPADFIIRATNKGGEKRVIYLYKRKGNPNNYFGRVEGQEELLTVQTFVIDRFLREKPYFLEASHEDASLTSMLND